MPNTRLSRLLTAALVLASAAATAADCPDRQLFLNQVGFTPDADKFVVLADSATAPLDWALVSSDGDTLREGRTRVYGEDPVAGLSLHHADFGDYATSGAGLTIRSGCAVSPRFDIAPQLFDALPYDALAYFYHNRSGIPIRADLAGSEALARPAGHREETVTCRRGRDAHGNDWPGCDYTLDVSGGWYDAGDQGKYVVNGGIAVWTLLNAWERQRAFGLPDAFSDGQAAIPEAGNGVSDLLDEARYELEFLLRMQAPPGAVATVPVGVKRNGPGIVFERIDASGMAHHKVADVNWTPVPTPPHLDREERVLFPVSTAATLNLAATAAQCARIWQSVDAAFADRCLAAAERAWAAARRNPAVYFVADFAGSGLYGDSRLDDEFVWAAAELFITTGGSSYRDALDGSPWFDALPVPEANWSQVATAGLVSLAVVPNALGSEAIRGLRARLVAAADGYLGERAKSGFRLPFASDRYVWGSNSVLLNRAILQGLANDFTGEAAYADAVVDVLDYLLGRNPLGRSYISGYGEHPMANPHHRFWAPSADAALPGPPPGVLSGGPNNTAMVDPVARAMQGKCAPLTCWRDDIEAYALNEVAINWNAPLVWVAAWLNNRRQPPDIAPTTRNGSSPAATAAGNGSSGSASE